MSKSEYDRVLKDLFQRDRPALLDRLTGEARIVEVLATEFQEMHQRRADLVLRLSGDAILHIEFQSENDKDIPYREGFYGLMIGQTYRCSVQQVVLYVGRERMNMPDYLDLGSVKVNFRLIDIREFKAEDLLHSGSLGDLPLAILAEGGAERLEEIVRRAGELGAVKRTRAVSQMVLLSGLRRLAGRLKMELKRVGMTIDIRENEILQDIYEEARAEGRIEGHAQGRSEGMAELLRGQLEARFGSLPAWARERLAKASTASIARSAKRILSAETLPEVLGEE